jgi:hypothetical protein
MPYDTNLVITNYNWHPLHWASWTSKSELLSQGVNTSGLFIRCSLVNVFQKRQKQDVFKEGIITDLHQ